MQNGCSIPPGKGEQTPRDIRDDIPPIPCDVPEEVRAPPLEKNGPKGQVQRDFSEGGRPIVVSEPEPPVQHKQRRKRARDEQGIIKPGVKKHLMEMRL